MKFKKEQTKSSNNELRSSPTLSSSSNGSSPRSRSNRSIKSEDSAIVNRLLTHALVPTSDISYNQQWEPQFHSIGDHSQSLYSETRYVSYTNQNLPENEIYCPKTNSDFPKEPKNFLHTYLNMQSNYCYEPKAQYSYEQYGNSTWNNTPSSYSDSLMPL